MGSSHLTQALRVMDSQLHDKSDFGLASAVDSHSTLSDIPHPTKNEYLAVISHQRNVCHHVPQSLEEVMMSAREPLEWYFKLLDQSVGLSFKGESVAALLERNGEQPARFWQKGVDLHSK